MDATIECGQCKNRMTVDTSLAGKHVQCPSCGEVVTVPADLQSGFPVEKPDDYIFCRQCGTRNAGNNFKCTQCGTVLHLPPQPGYVISDDMSMGGLIPYKNPKALWAYYLGIFSLFPMLGFPLGVASLILGVKGIKYANANPAAKGKAHAWVGVVLGGISVAGHSFVSILIAISIAGG